MVISHWIISFGGELGSDCCVGKRLSGTMLWTPGYNVPFSDKFLQRVLELAAHYKTKKCSLLTAQRKI